MYRVVGCWLISFQMLAHLCIDKQEKKMQPVQVVGGEAVVPWPGAGRCRRIIADIDEPAKKR